ncbi:MAG: Sigma-24 [Planctomycetota bacterium]
MPLTDLDRQLLHDLLAGNPGSWRLFVDRFSGLVQQVIRQTASAHSFRLSSDDADDLCADTFAELLLRDMAALRNFRGRCSFATYLAVIARRIVVRRMTEQRFLNALGHVNAHKAAVEQAAAEAPAARQIEHRDQVEHLLKSLPEESRKLLRWIYLDGLNWQETARRLGRPLNSIGPMLSRIRQVLQPSRQL